VSSWDDDVLMYCPGALEVFLFNLGLGLSPNDLNISLSSIFDIPMVLPLSSEPSALPKDANTDLNADLPSNTSSLSFDKKDSTVDVVEPSSDLVDAEAEPIKFTSLFFRRFYKPIDLDAIATRRSVYDDPALARHYWPKKNYENLHRFDPTARWTYREEQVIISICSVFVRIKRLTLLSVPQAIVRKIDWKVMLWAAISFSALNLDRNNLSQANTDNILGNLHMTTNGVFSFRLDI
jgi:hypothetical protein